MNQEPQYYKGIFGWFDYAEVYDKAVSEARDGAVFVEVGSFLGRSSCYLAERIRQSGKRITLFCVDHFKGNQDLMDVKELAEFLRNNGGTFFYEFLRNTGPFRDIIIPICCPSVEAATQIKDGTVDFIFIDAGHDEDSVTQDINAWRPKLKDGGMMAGHDYDMIGVRSTVNEYFPDRVLVAGKSWLDRPFDELAMFADWYLRQPFSISPCPVDGFQQVGPFQGLVLFREEQFQVQMWLCPPGSEAKEHSHAHVDTIQMLLSGEITLTLNGVKNCATMRGQSARIRQDQKHAFVVGEMGGAFLTIERWIGKAPGAIEEDWEGEAISEDHLNRLREKVRSVFKGENGEPPLDAIPESHMRELLKHHGVESISHE